MHSREDETEADEYGARYAAAAGYDSQALVRFFGGLMRRGYPRADCRRTCPTTPRMPTASNT